MTRTHTRRSPRDMSHSNTHHTQIQESQYHLPCCTLQISLHCTSKLFSAIQELPVILVFLFQKCIMANSLNHYAFNCNVFLTRAKIFWSTYRSHGTYGHLQENTFCILHYPPHTQSLLLLNSHKEEKLVRFVPTGETMKSLNKIIKTNIVD